MKVLIQKVNRASVKIDNKIYNQIENGYCIFLGIKDTDSEKDASYIVKKILKARLFVENDKFDKNIREVDGEILIISQFTLYGSMKKGNRPSFTRAMNPKDAKILYDKFIKYLQSSYSRIKTGIFGAHMEVELNNNGPLTIEIES